MEIDRRTLLQELAILLAGVGCARDRGAADASRSDARASDAGSNEARALVGPQRATLAAACARIIPTDHEPGAAEAEVIEYLDRELARPELATIKTNVLAGVTALGRFSSRFGGRNFAELAPEEQDEVLHQVETASDRGKDFLFILTVLTIEGFLGDPRWGGNKGGVGWSFIGYGPGTVEGHEH
jgi:gluconate 2-dehydrogenase gamma chain